MPDAVHLSPRRKMLPASAFEQIAAEAFFFVEQKIDAAIAACEVGREDLACAGTPLEGTLGGVLQHVAEGRGDCDEQAAVGAIEQRRAVEGAPVTVQARVV